MATNTKYILDAIKQTGPNTQVKVMLGGVATTISAKLALEQLHKPIKERRSNFRDIAPFEEINEALELTYENFIKEITSSQEPIAQSDNEPVSDLTMEIKEDEIEDSIKTEEVPESKKKKKQTNE